MNLAQIKHKKVGGPDRLPIAEVARIGIENVHDQRLDNTSGYRRSASSLGVGEALGHLQILALQEAINPVVDCRSCDTQTSGDLTDRYSGREPENGQRTAQNLCILGVMDQDLYGSEFVYGDSNLDHSSTSSLCTLLPRSVELSKNF
jgi:hypothetical protein